MVSSTILVITIASERALTLAALKSLCVLSRTGGSRSSFDHMPFYYNFPQRQDLSYRRYALRTYNDAINQYHARRYGRYFRRRTPQAMKADARNGRWLSVLLLYRADVTAGPTRYRRSISSNGEQ